MVVALDKGWRCRMNTNTLAQDADYLTHEGEGNRWKQSGIRDDVRPGTHEEG